MDRIFSIFQFFGIVAEFVPGAVLVGWIGVVYLNPGDLSSVGVGAGLLIALVMLSVAFSLGSLVSAACNWAVWKILGMKYLGMSPEGSPTEDTDRFVETWKSEQFLAMLSGIAARARLYAALGGVGLLIMIHALAMASGLLDMPARLQGFAFLLALVSLVLAASGAVLSSGWWQYWRACQNSAIRVMKECELREPKTS